MTLKMKVNHSDYIERRVIETALYTIKNKSTVRETGKYIGVSKSTIHKDLTKRLPEINYELYKKVNEILQTNKDERHVRGGIATSKKYKARKRKLSLVERWEIEDEIRGIHNNG